MVATTTPPPDAGLSTGRTSVDGTGLLTRFDRVERAVHWTNAALFLFLILSGETLNGAPGTGWVGNKRIVIELHTYVGYGLLVPVLLGIATHAGHQLRDDMHRIARWTADDHRWWRRASRGSARIGKFNPGQKLNAAFIGACILVMPASGTFLRWPAYFPHSFVNGADFTHRWFALAILVVTVGHILMALARPASLRGMITGKVPRAWAREEHPRWYAEMTGNEATASGRPEPATKPQRETGSLVTRTRS